MTHFSTKSSIFAIAASLVGGGMANAQTASQATTGASAQTAPTSPSADAGEIVVTAQKRSESINSVPLSINAASGDDLVRKNITETADLVRVVPGFTATTAQYGQPVYVLRGVGLYDSGLASSPAVSVYVDQFPLVSPVMSELAPFDLERVEVLKGPQGILFGANSTGGLINYIAAKPTSSFAAGGNVTYERFGRIDADAYVSGPLSDTLSARLAVKAQSGGAYQYSLSRPGDRLGNQRNYQIRGILDWHPTNRLKFELTLNGFRDNSDTQAWQLLAKAPNKPANVSPYFTSVPLAPDSPRAADWYPGLGLRSNDKLYQAALRADYEVAPSVNFSLLSSYVRFDGNKLTDLSGLSASTTVVTNGPADTAHSLGRIRNVNEEARFSGASGPLTWTVGGNYEHQTVNDLEEFELSQTYNQPIPGLPGFKYPAGLTKQRINTYALFANGDYRFGSHVTLHAGLRGTQSNRDADSCSFSWNPAGDGNALENTFTVLQSVFSGLGIKTTPVVAIGPGGCVSLTPAPDLSPSDVPSRLHEHNLSYRAGLDYKTDGGTLLYGSVSRGWKSGVISTFAASATSEFTPAKQERLDAYEVGFKAPIADRRYHLNGAAFYYGYSNKQLRTKVIDPVFGPLDTLQNIPKSRIIGVELDGQAQPITGLNLSGGITYLNSKVTKSVPGGAFNGQGVFGSLEGSRLPYTPKVQAFGDIEYDRPVSNRVSWFIGGSATYHSVSNATFSTPQLPAPIFKLNAYTLIDLRAGLTAPDRSWSVTVFGKNVTNKFYTTAINSISDEFSRLVGRPATYGVTLSLRYK